MLDSLLRSISEVGDLPRLARALGFDGIWEELLPGPWGTPAKEGAVSRAAIVGRGEGFLWIGLETINPDVMARRAAQRLLRQGAVGGVMAIDSARRRLALAVGFGEVRSLELALDAPGQLATACLGRIEGGAERGGLATAARLAAAISGEDVGTRFFEGLRAALGAMADALPAPASREDRRTLALLQLTRVLFLYFVQAKGWLNGESDFLASRVDACLAARRQIHRDLLRPLFFGTLNRRIGARRRAAEFGRIPFLNGGLFEPHGLERRWRVDVPNEAWRQVFDGVFERFHFTLNEPAGGAAVAPDMLGRVFEGVMDPDLRHASGTYYTPSSLVDDLLEAAFAALVASRNHCSDEEAARRVESRDPSAVRLLRDIALLDPAAGSGAFLLGALERLAVLQADRDRSGVKREILRRNLFGVDLSPMAVRLAELRLWLAVIADDREDRPEAVLPLPNLDCLIRQGDSLLDPIGAMAGMAPCLPARSRLLAGARQRFVIATGEEKRDAARALRRAELEAMAVCLDQARAALELQIAECLGQARSPTLFGERRGLDAELKRQLGGLRSRLHGVRRAERRLRRDGELPWFQYQAQFADVFGEKGGFDLVVGNPPWIRAEQLAPSLRHRLAQRYRWWRVGAGGGFAHQPDLAVAFAERAHELCAPGGVVALLVPAKLAHTEYASRLRQGLSGSSTLHAIANLTDAAGHHFEATVYPLAIVASKTPPTPRSLVRERLAPTAAPTVPQTALLGGAPWIVAAEPIRRALEEMHTGHPRLGDRWVIQLGVKTGANHVFLNCREPIEPSLVRWALRGRDIRPFRGERRATIIWTHDRAGRVYPSLPPLASEYFDRHLAILRARIDYRGGPPWALFRTRPATAPHRVVWSDLARALTALALSDPGAGECIPLNSCYVIALDSNLEAACLAAWLNCTWVRAAARLSAAPASGGFFRFNARIVGALPFPQAAAEDAVLPQLAAAAARGTVAQEDLDARCAELLGLSINARRALGKAADIPPGC